MTLIQRIAIGHLSCHAARILKPFIRINHSLDAVRTSKQRNDEHEAAIRACLHLLRGFLNPLEQALSGRATISGIAVDRNASDGCVANYVRTDCGQHIRG
eukprot:scaffold477609_cov38-Prasinocladus_malaysianus.AAC.1